MAVTYQGTNKIVYQNLISDKGKFLWGNEGKLLTYQKGSQTNPQFSFIDSSVVVSWTNEFEKQKMYLFRDSMLREIICGEITGRGLLILREINLVSASFMI